MTDSRSNKKTKTFTVYCQQLSFTLVLLNQDLSFFENTVDPDQLASDEAS